MNEEISAFPHVRKEPSLSCRTPGGSGSGGFLEQEEGSRPPEDRGTRQLTPGASESSSHQSLIQPHPAVTNPFRTATSVALKDTEVLLQPPLFR